MAGARGARPGTEGGGRRGCATGRGGEGRGGGGKEVEEEWFLFLGRAASKEALLKMLSCGTFATELDETRVGSVGPSPVLNRVGVLEMIP